MRTFNSIFAIILFIGGGLLLSKCGNESPFMTKEEATQLRDSLARERDPFHFVKNVVAIIDNDIYYFNRLDEAPKKLTNSPSVLKTHVKLSADRTRIAYLNKDSSPVIIRADNGQLIQSLTQFSYLTQMDWAHDRLTLYMLKENKIFTSGEPLTVVQPVTRMPWPYDEVKSYSMNSQGDYGYFIRYSGQYFSTLKYHSTSKAIDKEDLNFDSEAYDYIDFYDDKGNFLTANNDPFDDGFERVTCIQNYNLWPAYEWDYELMNTPQFDANEEILIYGTMEKKIYQIKAVYLGTAAYNNHGLYDRLTKVVEGYTSKTPIYLDWVQ